MQGQESRSSQCSPVNTSRPEFARPDYNEFTDRELKALVTSFGYKTRTNRLQKIGCLDRLYDQRAAKPSLSAASDPNPEEEPIEPSGVRQKIRGHIKADQALWTQIVSYKAVDVDQLQIDLDFPCTKDEVRAVLDEFAIFGKATKRSKKNKK